MSNEEIVERLREYVGEPTRMTRQDRLCENAADAIEKLMLDVRKALMDHRSTIEDIQAESGYDPRDDPDSVG